MREYIGRVGEVSSINYSYNSIRVDFYHEDGDLDDFWYYPLNEAAKHLVIESNDLFPIY
jgi:hypothetical protein